MAHVYKRSAQIVGREFMGEFLLVPLVGRAASLTSVFATNGVGALIWKQLAAPQTEEGLVEAIVGEYDVSRDLAESDCRAFLEQLKRVGAVEVEVAR